MTDQELLELAAKAAEIKGEYREVFNGFVVDTAPFRDFVVWRPHTDDGDALRLAVKLRLVVDINDECGDIWVRQPWNPDCEVSVAMDDDPYAATRRAIVRAAAEIGRGME